MESFSRRHGKSKIDYRLLAGLKSDSVDKELSTNKDEAPQKDVLKTYSKSLDLKLNRKISCKKQAVKHHLNYEDRIMGDIRSKEKKDEISKNEFSQMEPYINESEGIEKQNVFICQSLEDVDTILAKSSEKFQFECDVCRKKFKTSSILQSHKIRHRKKSQLPFTCPYCDFRSASKIELVRHLNTHEKYVFSCPACDKTFQRDYLLNEHIKFHHIMGRILQCEKCGFQTKKCKQMKSHLLIHEGPAFSCPVCGSFFNHKRNLNAHMRKHAGNRLFKCDACHKEFSRSNDLTAHIKYVHKPTNSFECVTCKKTFPRIHNLKRHLLTHTKEKPFLCCYCDHSCNTQGNLLKHVRLIHDADYSYKDVLKAREEQMINNTKEELPLAKLVSMQEKGYEAAERVIDTLKEKGYTNLSLVDLQKHARNKHDAKVAAFSAKKPSRRRIRKRQMTHATVTGSSICENSADNSSVLFEKETFDANEGEVFYVIPQNFCLSVSGEKENELEPGILNVNDLRNTYSASEILPLEFEDNGEKNSFINLQDFSCPTTNNNSTMSKLNNCIMIINDEEVSKEELDEINLYQVVSLKSEQQYPIFESFEDVDIDRKKNYFSIVSCTKSVCHCKGETKKGSPSKVDPLLTENLKIYHEDILNASSDHKIIKVISGHEAYRKKNFPIETVDEHFEVHILINEQ